MGGFRYILTLVYLLGAVQLSAQIDTLNQLDSKNHKTGYWIVYGKDKPEKGYPQDGKIEEGNYENDRKEGVWIKYHKDGKTPRLIGAYKNGRPDGEYIFYYESGCIRKTGTYWEGRTNRNIINYENDCDLNISPSGSKIINSEEYQILDRQNINDTIRYYFDNGNTQMQMFWNEDTVKIAEVFYQCGDIKKRIKYDQDGAIIFKEEFSQSEACWLVENRLIEVGDGGPDGSGGIKKNGEPFRLNGYNKIYNKEDELWLDGVFKSGKLWDGKEYLYDSDGILMQIRIWKNGSYHSDGRL